MPIKWTEREWITVADEYSRIRSERPETGKLEAVKAALQVLPAERRRPAEPWIGTQFERKCKELRLERARMLPPTESTEEPESSATDSPPPPAEVTGTRVVWSPAELLQVQAAYFGLRLKGRFKQLSEAADEAQAVLPPHRRRLKSANLCSELNKAWLTHVAEHETREPAIPHVNGLSLAPPPTPLPIPPAASPASPLVPSALASTITAALTEQLAAMLAGALNHPTVKNAVADLASAFQAALMPAAAPEPANPGPVDEFAAWTQSTRVRSDVTVPNFLEAPPQERPHLPKVLVAGLLNSQVQTVSKTYKDRLDIRFWTKDKSPDQLRRMSDTCDVALGFTGFLSHSHDAILKDRAPRYERVMGGVTKLGEVLQKLVPEAQAAHH
jgi:hypothetical protein